MEPKVKNKPAVRLNEEQLKKLDEIAKEKYRGVSRSKAVAWMIEDIWEGMQVCPVVNSLPVDRQ
jgi:hypothetical protein